MNPHEPPDEWRHRRTSTRYIVFTSQPVDESRSQRLVRSNFLLSVGLIVLLYALSLLGVARNPDAFARYYYGGYGIRAVFGTIAMIAIQGMLWWHIYRRGGNDARLFAGVFGFLLLAHVIVQVGRASIGVPASTVVTWALVYASASHFAYAALGSRLREF